MIEKWLDPIFAPFRRIKSNYLAKKNLVGNAKVDAQRVKQMGGQAKAAGQKVNNAAGGLKVAPQAGVGVGAAPGVPGAPVPPGAVPQAPPKKKGGFMGLFGKKKARCQQCGQQQDPTWDQCPYCLQAQQAAAGAAGQAHAAAAAAPMKTQAFMVGQDMGAPASLLGWLVPIKGAQKGELFTLKAVVSIGTDPSCDVVLSDGHMSRKHAEIKIQGQSFWLYDLGSTNGTYVNDKRITQHELVDNDNVRFGQTPVKFKSL